MKKLIAVGVLLVLLLGWAILDEQGVSLPADGTSEAEEDHKEEETIVGAEKEPLSAEVPILVYHHFSDAKNRFTSGAKLETDLAVLREAGYTTVFYDDLYDYVYKGADLPDKPVIITFDDGYASNHEIAFPILQAQGAKVEISLIGCMIGKIMGEADWEELNSYLTWAQIEEMHGSGLVRFQSHTYKMHECPISGEADMLAAVKDDKEEYDYYVKFFKRDGEKMQKLFSDHLGYEGIVFTYPMGRYDETTEQLVTEMGYRITVGAEAGVNTVRRGDPESLRKLYRISADGYEGNVVKLIEYINREVMNKTE